MRIKDRIKELSKLDGGALQDELLRLKREQFNLRFQKATGQLENSARVREVRRDIARVRTYIRRSAAIAA